MGELLSLAGGRRRHEHGRRGAQLRDGGQHNGSCRIGHRDDGVVDAEQLGDDGLTCEEAGESR